jgi:hypothetical protein
VAKVFLGDLHPFFPQALDEFAQVNGVPQNARVGKDDEGARPVELLLEFTFPILPSAGEEEVAGQVVEVFDPLLPESSKEEGAPRGKGAHFPGIA